MKENGLIYFLVVWIVSICSVSCSCDMQIPHGDVTWWCASQGPPCPYSCHEGYKKHDKVSWLECSTSGQWVSWLSYPQVSAKDLCTPKPCPTLISKGAFPPACKAVVGSTCSFSCEAGYMRNTSVPELTCQNSTEWSPDLRSLCLRPDGQQCPYYIPRGDLSLTCIREPGQTCNFTCDEEYQPSISPSTIACGSDLKWNHNPESLCPETICPKLFEGGYVAESCSRKYKATCSAFQCNPGYVKLTRAYYVKCDKSGKWIDPDEKSSACVRIDQLCPLNFPGGNIIWHCNRIPQEVCTYDCYPGYLQNYSITWLTCQDNRLWDVDTNSLCIQSGTSMSSFNVSRSAGERSGDGNLGTIVGITVGGLTGILIITFFVRWIAKRSSVRKAQRREPEYLGSRCLRPRANSDQNVTTLRQGPNADVIGSVSSFESPSYNDLYVHSFVQRIPTISSSCNYLEPPPPYSKVPIAPNESPPAYDEVVTDPSRFNLYI